MFGTTQDRPTLHEHTTTSRSYYSRSAEILQGGSPLEDFYTTGTEPFKDPAHFGVISRPFLAKKDRKSYIEPGGRQTLMGAVL